MSEQDPFNCPKCGAHDYGLYLMPVGECPHCMKKERDALKAALAEAVCGWHDIDKRIRYVEVQIDKDEMRHIHHLLGLPAPEFK
jgi:hypothetical protein